MNGIENCVCHFMSHDVWTQAGEDQPAGIIGPLRLIGCGKITEQDRLLIRIVIRVGITNRVRIQAQALNIIPFGRGHSSRIPDDFPSERALEMANRFHRYRVNELLMKLWIAFTRCQAVLRCDLFGTKINRLVPALARWIDVDHLDVFADRSRFQAFKRNTVNDFVNHRRVQPRRKTRIERVSAQVTINRRVLKRFFVRHRNLLELLSAR